jgi:ABC-type uncharacterized transport system substrate-binding protein
VLRPAADDARFRRDFDGFLDALRESGFVEGTNLAIEYRMRPGPPEEILGLAAELVERPTQLALLINQTTAQALGVTIPPSRLARADEVIQR